MNSRERRSLDLAEKVAQKVNNGSTFFFGGVLTKNGTILNIGFNQPYKTHPKSPNRFKTIHCELDTILGVSSDNLYGANLFLVRLAYGKSQKAMAKPCSDCEQLIRLSGIQQVFYSVDNNSIGVWNVRKNLHRVVLYSSQGQEFHDDNLSKVNHTYQVQE